MRRRLLPLLFLLLAIDASAQDAAGGGFEVEPHPPFIQGTPFAVTIRALDEAGQTDEDFAGTTTLTVKDAAGVAIGEPIEVTFTADQEGVARVEELLVTPATEPDPDDAGSDRRTRASYYQPVRVTLEVAGQTSEVSRVLPDWAAVAPPLLAILLAILFRQVVIALLLGTMVGIAIVRDFDLGATFGATVTDYVVPAIADSAHASIVVFSLLLGGMVGVISKSGGTVGIVHALAARTSSRFAGQVSTAAIGSSIFFDDYANCLIVGNTMRPVTDRLRISREKLAYLVDSTAAPITSLVPLSTWVGAQIGYVEDGLTAAKLDGSQAYSLIIQSIPYMFYPIFALLMVFFVAFTGRDWFTMLYAERRAVREGKLLRDGAVPLAAGEEDEAIRAEPDAPKRAFNAVVPILTVVAVTIYGLIVTGWNGWEGATLDDGVGVAAREILGNADSYGALLWASFAGVAMAAFLAWIQRILSLNECVSAAMAGMKAMLLAMVILVLAWSLSAVTKQLHAIDYLHQLSVTFGIQGGWFPLLVFVLAAATAFATGTAWGTMSILVPIMVPLAYQMTSPLEISDPIVLGSIAASLGGAVFGDHCSPISDTTVLSSMASSCDHIDHVRTQLPYAVIGALVAAGAGYLPIAYGYPVWATLPVGAIALFVLVRFVFRPVDIAGGGPDPALPTEEAPAT